MVRLTFLATVFLSGCVAAIQYDPNAEGACGDGSTVTVFTPVTGVETLEDCRVTTDV